MPPQAIVDVTIEDLPNIKPISISRLKRMGIESVLELATAIPQEIAAETGENLDIATALVIEARNALSNIGLLSKEFCSATEIMNRRKQILRCSTGSKTLDGLLGGGIETQALTEIAGEFGSGKSQLCHTLSVIGNMPKEKNGFGGNVIFIDTENTFRPERVHEIAEAYGVNAEKILSQIFVCKIYNSSHLELIIKELAKYLEELRARLVIIDSVISLHRAEFSGRETLWDRQQRLNSMLHRLSRLAEVYNIAFILTNQVSANPDGMFAGDPNKVTGGNIMAHATTYRIFFRKAGHNRIAVMQDSPCHEYGSVKFTITEKGIVDSEEVDKNSR
ncbi:MAG: DNA repair and recombination protein RadA [Candidatus Eiseniibacteriota bacterium]